MRKIVFVVSLQTVGPMMSRMDRCFSANHSSGLLWRNGLKGGTKWSLFCCVFCMKAVVVSDVSLEMAEQWDVRQDPTQQTFNCYSFVSTNSQKVDHRFRHQNSHHSREDHQNRAKDVYCRQKTVSESRLMSWREVLQIIIVFLIGVIFSPYFNCDINKKWRQ